MENSLETKITALKDMFNETTLNFLFLNAITSNTYLVFWLIERYKIFNQMAGRTIISRTMLIVLLVLITLPSAILASYLLNYEADGGLYFLLSILSIAWIVPGYMIVFSISKTMQFFYLDKFGVDLKFNTFYLVIFGLFYINYMINDLEMVEQKEIIKKMRNNS